MIASVAEMGRELARLWARADDLDDRSCEAAEGSDERRALDRQRNAVLDRLYAVEDLMAESRAVDLRDALAQIILAAGHLATLNLDEWVAQGEVDECLRKRAVQAQKLLTSAIAGIEREHGLDRDTYAGDTYAGRQLDPHLMEDAA